MRGIRTGIRTGISSMVAAALLAGSAIMVAAQDEPADSMATVWVTGEIGWASTCDGPTLTNVDGVSQERGHRCESRTVTSDDPRLSGPSVIIWNKDVHTTEDNHWFSTLSIVEDIRGDDGGWICRAAAGLDEGANFLFDSVQGSYLYVCTGDGDNAGLSALLVVEPQNQADRFEGLVFPGELPPAPEMIVG